MTRDQPEDALAVVDRDVRTGVEEVDGPPTGDRVAGWMLLVGQVALAVVLTVVGYMWWALVGLGCSDTPSEACEATEIEALMGLFAILPWVVLLATLAWMIVRIRRRLRIWWVPLATGALPPASLFLSMLLTPQ